MAVDLFNQKNKRRKGLKKRLKRPSKAICETTLTRLKFILKVLEGEKQQKGTEKLFEDIMAENLPNLGKRQVSRS